LKQEAIDSNFNQHCSIALKTNSGQLNIFLIYRPPNSNAENLNLLCELLEATNPNTVVIGDFNLPCISWGDEKSAGRGRGLLEASMTAGLTQLVDFPTHRKGNILDLLLTNRPEKFMYVKDGGCLGNSDHCIIIAEIEIEMPKIKTAPRINWSRGNYEAIRNEFSELDWKNEINGRDLESAWQFLKARLMQLVEKHVPKSVSTGAAKPRWLSREIIRNIRKKKQAWKVYKKEGGLYNKGKYEEASKIAKKSIMRAKKNVEKHIAHSNDKNNRQFTNYKKTKTRTPVGPIKLEGGGLAVENLDIAER
jgi:hypothetical protein